MFLGPQSDTLSHPYVFIECFKRLVALHKSQVLYEWPLLFSDFLSNWSFRRKNLFFFFFPTTASERTRSFPFRDASFHCHWFCFLQTYSFLSAPLLFPPANILQSYPVGRHALASVMQRAPYRDSAPTGWGSEFDHRDDVLIHGWVMQHVSHSFMKSVFGGFNHHLE